MDRVAMLSSLRRREMILFGQRRSVLPSRGVLGGALCLLFVVLYFVVFDGFRAHPKGISVMLSVPASPRPQALIEVRQDKDESIRYYLNHKSVSREALTSSLRTELGSRPGFVSVEADVNTPYKEVVYAMDSAAEVGAKVLILSPQQTTISKKNVK
jgi:biopolymer transport protein ExbD